MIRKGLLSFLARFSALIILSGVATVCLMSRIMGRRRPKATSGSKSSSGFLPQPVSGASGSGRRLLVMGTFYNVGWFRSHILPLAKCSVLTEIIVVCDEPLFPVSKVCYRCTPQRLVKYVGRSLARMLWLIWTVRRHRPDVLMGYHIMPNALICLVAARLYGGYAIYQMTGGPIQLIGGGVGSENILLRHLGRSSRILERLLFHVVREFDHIIVRGQSARDFVAEHHLGLRCSIITGSVDVERFRPDECARQYDIVYVSRLVPRKGLDEFLEILAALVQRRPSLRAAIVGDGPWRQRLQDKTASLNLEGHVDFLGAVDHVEKVLQRSRLFMLVSPSEGLSIAMMEAMACGLPAVVTDVGDLRDLVKTDRTHQWDQTGVLLDSPAPDRAVDPILRILENDGLWSDQSQAARDMVVARASVGAVAERWNDIFGGDSSLGEAKTDEHAVGSSCDRRFQAVEQPA